MTPIKDIMTIDIVKKRVKEYGDGLLKNFKKYDYFNTSDGYVIELRPARACKIQSTIYESDEDVNGNYRTAKDIAPTEDALKQLFFNENMRLDGDYTPKEWENLYISEPMFAGSNLRTIYHRLTQQIDWWHDVERKLTWDEIEWLKKYYAEQKRLMLERLERYWKRYHDKIYIHTYWANA